VTARITRDRHARARCAIAAAALAVSAWSGPAHAAFDVDGALAAGTEALGTSVANHTLVNRAGTPVELADLRGKPILVHPVYTSCYHSCNVLTRYLREMVVIARGAVGEDAFRVVTVGFDTASDTPEQMREYANRNGVDDEHWLFLSGTPATISALTREIGFRYAASPQGFDHLAQVTMLDAEGRVYRQLYSDAFPAPALVEPLKELVFGRRAQATSIDGWINGVKLLCTVYDPTTGAYTFDYSLFIGAAIGTLCLGGVAVFLVRAWRQHEPRGPRVRGQHT
jgi:protein SCO1/2